MNICYSCQNTVFLSYHTLTLAPNVVDVALVAYSAITVTVKFTLDERVREILRMLKQQARDFLHV